MNSPKIDDYPQNFEAYQQLCEQRGVEPLLDSDSFNTTLASIREELEARGDKEKTRALIEKLLPSSEQDLLGSLGASVHLAELVMPGCTEFTEEAPK